MIPNMNSNMFVFKTIKYFGSCEQECPQGYGNYDFMWDI